MHYETNWQHGTSVYDGIHPLLQTLQAKGHPLAVLSNKPHDFTQAIVASLFSSIHFSAVLGQRLGIPHKPDPSGALETSRCLERVPGNCLIVGDSTMDLETASRAGMRSIAVAWGFQDREMLTSANFIADVPADILTAIESFDL